MIIPSLCSHVYFRVGVAKEQEKKNQCRAIRREFELVGPTLLKNSLGAGWGLLAT